MVTSVGVVTEPHGTEMVTGGRAPRTDHANADLAGDEVAEDGRAVPVESPETSGRESDRVDEMIRPELDLAIESLDGQDPTLSGMVRYHLGLVDARFAPLGTEAVTRAQGKRLRPRVALLCCRAVGGDPAVAAPLAAALELLHNFTLIHDDIQDQSAHRRHRPTVWAIWGAAQAINAGDALFAAAHLPLFRLPTAGVSLDLTLRLVEAFDRMTIEIVRGQVLDLSFEGGAAVSPDDYLAMIDGKTAAIVRYAAWAGALLGGADEGTADRLATFGQALGVGFQIRDDLLGIWGSPAETGKPAADDLRRRKQSLPVVLLRTGDDPIARDEVTRWYAGDHIDEAGVGRVLSLLEAAGVRAETEAHIAQLHDRARSALLAALPDGLSPARDVLMAYTDTLANRVD
ncbi:MAG: Geranylgeranyl diphosphate synthase [uncultured Thermomicrobiales bacterium]|uniref:Geranylgeranyl diphosphate synthase n=1 Tax=uncultured Thermomicrobiales bacterium TaxID=1645740 RepID=A0A6J4UWL0_9BACT|nr:MAG: Geranylgeranyl diphosphate synthase [uncultured Thermomicrobiales bacterium]